MRTLSACAVCAGLFIPLVVVPDQLLLCTSSRPLVALFASELVDSMA